MFPNQSFVRKNITKLRHKHKQMLILLFYSNVDSLEQPAGIWISDIQITELCGKQIAHKQFTV